jgi:hypothetical protein
MKTTFLTVAACGLFALSSCTPDNAVTEQIAPTIDLASIVDENEDGYTNLPAYEGGDAIIEDINGHSIDFSSVEKVTETRPDGTTETMYLLDGDIELTEEQLREFKHLDATGQKQYRTNNLVTDNSISVIGYTGSGYNLTSKMRSATQWAINNYNALNTSKTFTLSFAASTNADIVVYRNINSTKNGGRAGFPSGGQPYKWVQIYNGMESFSTNANEHVITHEIGHCMGLRHTDWFSRQSCGESGEAAGANGAVYIPGTLSGYDSNSLMLACFSASTNGEFGFYDRVALEYLY